jgi:O-antigen ligase
VLFLFVLLYLTALYVRPGELFSALQALPVVDYLSGAALCIAMVTMTVSPRKFWDQPHDKFFIAYFLIAVASNPLNGWIAGGQETFMLFLPAAFCYFLIRAGVRSTGQIKWTMRTLVLLNVFLAVNALLPIFAPEMAIFTPMETAEGVRIQGTGIFSDPNDLGMTLVMTLPMVMSTMVGGRVSVFSRAGAAFALVIILTACYYTNSRGTMLGIAIVFTIYAYRRVGAVVAIMMAGIAFSAILAFGPSRMANVSSSEASAQGRIQAWVAGYDMLQSSPIWGVGWQRFDDIHYRVAHNSFVHVLGELGIIGAFCFMGMYYWYFVSLRRQQAVAAGTIAAPAPTRPAVVRIARDLSDSGVGLLTAMCFLSRQYTVTAFILLALVACLASASDEQRPRNTSTLVAHGLAVGSLTFVGIVFFYVVARVLAQYG